MENKNTPESTQNRGGGLYSKVNMSVRTANILVAVDTYDDNIIQQERQIGGLFADTLSFVGKLCGIS